MPKRKLEDEIFAESGSRRKVSDLIQIHLEFCQRKSDIYNTGDLAELLHIPVSIAESLDRAMLCGLAKVELLCRDLQAMEVSDGLEILKQLFREQGRPEDQIQGITTKTDLCEAFRREVNRIENIPVTSPLSVIPGGYYAVDLTASLRKADHGYLKKILTDKYGPNAAFVLQVQSSSNNIQTEMREATLTKYANMAKLANIDLVLVSVILGSPAIAKDNNPDCYRRYGYDFPVASVRINYAGNLIAESDWKFGTCIDLGSVVLGNEFDEFLLSTHPAIRIDPQNIDLALEKLAEYFPGYHNWSHKLIGTGNEGSVFKMEGTNTSGEKISLAVKWMNPQNIKAQFREVSDPILEAFVYKTLSIDERVPTYHGLWKIQETKEPLYRPSEAKAWQEREAGSTPTYFIVTDFVNGSTLNSLGCKKTDCAMVEQAVLEAIQRWSEMGIGWYDWANGANIIIEEKTGKPYFIDFGTAELLKENAREPFRKAQTELIAKHFDWLKNRQ